LAPIESTIVRSIALLEAAQVSERELGSLSGWKLAFVYPLSWTSGTPSIGFEYAVECLLHALSTSTDGVLGPIVRNDFSDPDLYSSCPKPQQPRIVDVIPNPLPNVIGYRHGIQRLADIAQPSVTSNRI